MSKCLATCAWSCDAVVRALRTIAVLMPPGCTQVTLTGCLAMIISWRSASVKPRTANFAELYAVWPGIDEQAEEAGDVHDVAVTGLDQVRQELLGALHDAPEVDVHDPLEVVVGHLLEVAVQRDAGVVDDHVDPAELAADRGGVLVHRLAVADVDLVRAHLPLQQGGARLHLPRGLDQTDLVPVAQRQDRALPGRLEGELAADAGAGSGDHDHLAVESLHAETFLSVPAAASRCGTAS